MNVRQTILYSRFLERIGWRTNSCQQATVLVCSKTIGPFSLIKVLRPKTVPKAKEIKKIIKKNSFTKIQIEFENCFASIEEADAFSLSEAKKINFSLAKSAFLPTASVFINLNFPEKKIFSGFTEAKRRAVRRAQKHNLEVFESSDIDEFINLKKIQLWPFGFLLDRTIKKLWKVFSPAEKAVLLLAKRKEDQEVLAGVFLLFHEKTAYYWLASSTQEGKLLFAPTLLVWEALKLAKKRKMLELDFEGIVDERFPETKSWSGFSKFKTGFGGKIVYYPRPIQKIFWPTL